VQIFLSFATNTFFNQVLQRITAAAVRTRIVRKEWSENSSGIVHCKFFKSTNIVQQSTLPVPQRNLPTPLPFPRYAPRGRQKMPGA